MEPITININKLIKPEDYFKEHNTIQEQKPANL